MSKSVTAVIDEDLDKKLRMLQAKMIQNSSSAVSFSKVINEVLRKNMKKQLDSKLFLIKTKSK